MVHGLTHIAGAAPSSGPLIADQVSTVSRAQTSKLSRSSSQPRVSDGRQRSAVPGPLKAGAPASNARRLPTGGGSCEFSIELAHLWDNRAFLLDGVAGTLLQVTLDSTGDGRLRIDGPHFLQVDLASGTPYPMELTSTIKLTPFHDPDDGRTIAVGDIAVGNVHFPSDWDWYSIHLTRGEAVRISADSASVDTLMFVDFPESQEQWASDDDSGGGLFGTNAEMVFRAPRTGEFFIIVGDALGSNIGGYYLSVVASD